MTLRSILSRRWEQKFKQKGKRSGKTGSIPFSVCYWEEEQRTGQWLERMQSQRRDFTQLYKTLKNVCTRMEEDTGLRSNRRTDVPEK